MECVTLIIDSLSAIGTCGAAVIALCLALRDQRQRIDCAFMWETATGDKPMLILNNIGNHTVIVERIDLFFDKQKIGSIDVLRTSAYCENAIISPNREVRIAINSNALTLNIEGRPIENPDIIYELTAVVITTSKKRYKSSYRYCYNDIQGLIYSEDFKC